MSTGIINIIKRASMDAMDNAQLCDFRTGTVVDVSPLRVRITQQFTIPSSMLIVPKHLTNYKVDITTDESTEKQTLTIHNELKVGDKVALLRKQGGQSYFILDRI